MVSPCPSWIALSLMLLPLWVSAQPVQWNEQEEEKVHYTRRVLLRQEPADGVVDIYVAENESTIIRLPLDVYARGTGIFGGSKERFEVLVDGDQIVVTPRRGLAQGERIPMFVTLADGTLIRLSLTSASEDHRTDGLVKIRKEPENPGGLAALPVSTPEEVESLQGQAQEEKYSPGPDLAGLLAWGRADLTVFFRVKERSFANRAGRKFVLETYAVPPDVARKYNLVAATFSLTNNGTEPLEFSVARAFRAMDQAPVPLAFSAQPRVIPPGGVGRLAVVVDRGSFGLSDGMLAIDFFSKAQGGRCEFSVDLAIGDFKEGESWWRSF